MTIRHIVLVAVITVALARNTASSQTPAATWQPVLRETSELLDQQQFGAARDRLRKLIAQMADTIYAAGPADRMLAIALGQLAVADAGLGNEEDAVWHWYIAQNIDPDVRKVDLSRYDDVGRMLSRHNLTNVSESCARSLTARAPGVRKRNEPAYPTAARERRVGGFVIVEVSLTSDGKPIQPRVLKTPLSVLTYSTLASLQRWRFDPPRPENGGDVPFCRVFKYGP